MSIIPTIAVLLTCHNRKDKTLQCLQALFAQEGLGEDYAIEVFLVDDGSTDGSAEAIQFQFSKVTIIPGDGNLYWNRGMLKAWETAAATKDFDYYLWLNDDTFLYKNTLNVLLENIKYTNNHSIVCGVCKSKSTNSITYGGFKQSTHQLINPNGIPQKCYFFNGNIVLIPKEVYKKNGMLDPYFRHAFGDFDYGLRALKQNIFSYISSEAVGVCEENQLSIWCNPKVSLLKRLKNLYTPLGMSPIQHFVYAKRHWGIIKGSKTFFSIHLRVFFPNLWL